MNGEDKKLAVELFDMWREQHDSAAKEVRSDVKWLVKEFGKLPCAVHIERMKYFKIGLIGLYIVVGYLVFSLVTKYIGV